jgi:glycosyltransferase involved in cell wall biosynthesis
LGSFDCNPTSIKKELIEEYEKKGVIDYLGYKTDVRPYIKNSYAVVLPSYHEGQGRVLAEGMAMGRPVIASDVPGCRQTVRNKVNGLLVPPKDYKALADAMIYLYKNPETGIKMGEEGYKIAKEVFDVDKINEKILNEMGIIS